MTLLEEAALLRKERDIYRGANVAALQALGHGGQETARTLLEQARDQARLLRAKHGIKGAVAK